MSFEVTLKIKDLFFDRSEIIRRMDAATHRALFKAGGNIRQRARKSMKLRGLARGAVKTERLKLKQAREVNTTPASPPGKPPNVHSPDEYQSLRFILFGADGPHRVIVGPVGLNQKSSVGGILSAGTIPQLHEFGGTAAVIEKRVGLHWVPKGRRSVRSGQPVRKRTGKYPPRPFMAPAMEKELPKFPELWANTISG